MIFELDNGLAVHDTRALCHVVFEDRHLQYIRQETLSWRFIVKSLSVWQFDSPFGTKLSRCPRGSLGVVVSTPTRSERQMQLGRDTGMSERRDLYEK
ncbi:hypothetical protein CDV31_014055 [Fusarium ambrosium]|uniref:Uncharacterized protein n=1 Tax=Fusarium ambrosium TaxID=131363 RepID=A0A428SZ13_9HYPO|nr:hypothetical protein CDV31_014055 [Fusarium ambrosium]